MSLQEKQSIANGSVPQGKLVTSVFAVAVGATAPIIGVSLSTALTAHEFTLCALGLVKGLVRAGAGGVTAGTLFTSDANGDAIALGAGTYYAGIAFTTAIQGAYFDAFILPGAASGGGGGGVPTTPADALIGVNDGATAVVAKSTKVAGSILTQHSSGGVNGQVSVEIDGSTSPSILPGNGAPVAVRDDGSLFLRGDGGSPRQQTAYIRENGIWQAILAGNPKITGMTAGAIPAAAFSGWMSILVNANPGGTGDVPDFTALADAGKIAIFLVDSGTGFIITAGGITYTENGAGTLPQAVLVLFNASTQGAAPLWAPLVVNGFTLS